MHRCHQFRTSLAHRLWHSPLGLQQGAGHAKVQERIAPCLSVHVQGLNGARQREPQLALKVRPLGCLDELLVGTMPSMQDRIGRDEHGQVGREQHVEVEVHSLRAKAVATRQQAEADKEIEEESEVTTISAELKPGERKIISDGTEGPVVEIIKRSGVEPIEVVDDPEAVAEAQSSESEENSEVEMTGEQHDNN